jgi:hypothetical protein
MNLETQKLGGKVTAIKLRREALERYYINPNKCLNCGKIIEVPEKVKVQVIRAKKFCHSSCSAKYNNNHRVRKIKELHERVQKDYYRICSLCKKDFITKHHCRKRCEECRNNTKLEDRTKGELFLKRKNYQSARSTIVHHAAKTYEKSDKPKKCLKCSYDNHYEVCHIKDVKDFPNEALIKEINHIDNLIALCPTHHWELDNGLLNINNLSRDIQVVKVESLISSCPSGLR